MTACPVTSCTETDDLDDDGDLFDHLFTQHDEEELAAVVVRLTRTIKSAHANTECQMCGNYGATPGDHPLCPDCENGLRS
jgi:hypothetical protein